jgi:hypothetical protein
VGVDANLRMMMSSGSPTVFFDANDGIVYDRPTNAFLFYINNVLVAKINSAGNLQTKGTITASSL